MSLLKQIQKAATDSTVPISDLLRMCKVLASELDAKDFGEWVDGELGGYKSNAKVPEYRIFDPPSYGNFIGIGWSQLNHTPIPVAALPQKYRLGQLHLTQPISALAQLATNAKSNRLTFPWPAELIAVVGDKILQGYSAHSAWRELPTSVLVGIVDTVRTRVLSFVLELRKAAGESSSAAETADDSVPALPSQTVQHFFITTIMGGVGQFAAGGSGFQQQMSMTTVDPGDLAALKDRVLDLGASDDDVKQLESAVAEDAAEGQPTKAIGDKTSSWLGKMVSKASAGGWKVGADVAGSVLTKLVLSYLGISS